MTNRTAGCFVVLLTAAAVGCAHAPPAAAHFPCLAPGPEWAGSLWSQRVQAYPGGFGGWFHGRVDGRGEPDKLNVYFLDPERGVRSLHADHPGSFYNILQGQYTILQLHSCLKALRGNPALSGLGAFQVDEPRNRIALAIQDTAIADSVRRILGRSKVVPPDMVMIQKMEMGLIR